jgi:hypothetical protein
MQTHCKNGTRVIKCVTATGDDFPGDNIGGVVWEEEGRGGQLLNTKVVRRMKLIIRLFKMVVGDLISESE